mmetsp:Transcript_9144/g.19602  ORF Transcript_9144/g.19602 Transcript_9144/m.19602 type:complete len:195 (+) Transcript_9144:593-1177(+)
MSLRNIFKRHKESVAELRQDAAQEVVRLQDKLTRVTVELEMERSMRFDAVSFANSVKDHRSSSHQLNFSDDEKLDGDNNGSCSHLDVSADSSSSLEGPDAAGGSSAEVAAAASAWKKKLQRSKRVLAHFDDTHKVDETAEELEQLIMEKYETERLLRKDLAERDATIRKLKATVNGQAFTIAELTKELEKTGTA